MITLPWGTHVRARRVESIDIATLDNGGKTFHVVAVEKTNGKMLISEPIEELGDAEKMRDAVAMLVDGIEVAPLPRDEDGKVRGTIGERIRIVLARATRPLTTEEISMQTEGKHELVCDVIGAFEEDGVVEHVNTTGRGLWQLVRVDD